LVGGDPALDPPHLFERVGHFGEKRLQLAALVAVLRGEVRKGLRQLWRKMTI
jgi:hypothetical protein